MTTNSRTAGWLLGLASLAVALPCEVRAGASTDNATPFNLNQTLNFRLVYPRFLRFRVGTNSATIDQITFTVPGVSVGNSAPVSGTGGDAGGGSAANVEVLGNAGQVTITPTNNSGGLGLGTGVPADGRINYNRIQTTSSSGQLGAPVLSNAGGSAVLPTVTGVVTQRTAVWTYSYLNTTIPNAGTYGTSANGGRVTYTATMP